MIGTAAKTSIALSTQYITILSYTTHTLFQINLKTHHLGTTIFESFMQDTNHRKHMSAEITPLIHSQYQAKRAHNTSQRDQHPKNAQQQTQESANINIQQPITQKKRETSPDGNSEFKRAFFVTPERSRHTFGSVVCVCGKTNC